MRRATLVFTIQYAVVCRHEDRHSWLTSSIDNPSDPILTRAHQAFQRGCGSLPIQSRQYIARDTTTQLYTIQNPFSQIRYVNSIIDTTLHSSMTSTYIFSHGAAPPEEEAQSADQAVFASHECKLFLHPRYKLRWIESWKDTLPQC